jgi:hypothetical protein
MEMQVCSANSVSISSAYLEQVRVDELVHVAHQRLLLGWGQRGLRPQGGDAGGQAAGACSRRARQQGMSAQGRQANGSAMPAVQACSVHSARCSVCTAAGHALQLICTWQWILAGAAGTQTGV